MFAGVREKSVRMRDLVGVFDLDTATVSGITRNYLSSAEKRGAIVGTESLPKFFMVVSSGGEDRVYLTSRGARGIGR